MHFYYYLNKNNILNSEYLRQSHLIKSMDIQSDFFKENDIPL